MRRLRCAAADLAIVFAALFATTGTLQAAEREVILKDVEIHGLTVFTPDALESSIEIGAGDKLERAKVIRTATNLQAFYRLHGYEQMGIRTQLVRRKNEQGKAEDILEISIQEGLPTRIAQASIVPEGLTTPLQRKYWDRLVPAVAARLSVNRGDLFDQEKLNVARRGIQDILASNEFVGARVDDVRINETERPPGLEDLTASKWVSVEFHVRPGERVAFGFRGNTIFSQTRLLSVVEDRRILGFGKDYVQAIGSRIEEEYRALGYALIHIDTYTYEDPSDQGRHVTYDIKEGPRVRLENVEFDGNEAFANEALRTQFFAKASAILQQGYFVEKDAKKAAELAVEWMKSKGYLSAKLVTINTAYLPRKHATDTTRSVRLTIYVYEWDQTLVQSVTVKGAQAISTEEIHRTLGAREGEPLNLFAFNEGIEALKNRYRARGYLNARILNEGSETVVHYSQDNRSADITIDLFEGAQYRASKIIIEGLSLTKEYVVRRELSFREGDVLEEPKLLDSEGRLRRFGFFSGLAFRVTDDPDREGYKVVRILIQEGTPGVYGGGLGFRNDVGVRVFGGVSYNNLWGMNHTIAIDTAVNRRVDNLYRFGEYQAQLVYVYPWFLLDEMTFRPTFSLIGKRYTAFDAFTTSLALPFERKLLPRLTGVFSYSLERVRQETPNPNDFENQLLTIGALTTTVRLDHRDNPLSPTSGFYANASFELAAPWLLSAGQGFPVGYTRFQIRGDYFIPITSRITWYLSVRTGLSRSTEEPFKDAAGNITDQRSGAIPLIKHFALGGAGSLRGFQDQELNDYSFAIRGTQSYVNYRTQLDLPFSGALRFGPFLDAANLQHDTFSLGNVRYGGGVGFHYETPVGPVNLDYGLKFDPRSGEDASAVYFSIGVI